MKALERYIYKIKPRFEKGGRYEKWLSVFESFETFFFVPAVVTKAGSHIRDALDMKRTMSVVVIALIPALLFGIWNTGHYHFLATGEADIGFWTEFWYGFLKILPLLIVSYAVGLGTEFVFVYVKGHEINEGFFVSGLLIPLIVPPDVPLWMLAVATVFAVVLGKEVFGGTGMNVLNPALLTRAFLFFAYPAWMSGDKVWVAGLAKGEGIVDGFSGATPLADAAAGSMDNLPNVWDMFIGFYPGSIGETSTLAILLGAAFLLYTGIGSFRIMASVFVGGFAMAYFLNLIAPVGHAYMNMPAYQHLLLGGFAFGAVFMATDPVTASQTARGKIIYGLLIGILTVIIRVFNPGYPEGMMLAILLMNIFAPLIDHYVVQGNIRRRKRRMKLAAS